jgi:hypothetical protein
MKFLALLSLLVVTAAWSSVAVAGNGTGINAVPAATKPFAGTYSATFVRSASGLVNETNRVNSAGVQNPWTSSDVWLQFRPTSNPSGGVVPNPTCDPNGLVTAPFTYAGGTDPELNPSYFNKSVDYNVCVYLVNPVVASGGVDSHDPAGTSISLPSTGHYRIDVSGTWTNSSYGPIDAEYTSIDNWTTQEDGFDVLGWNLGPNFGDLTVGGQFVDWGTYTPSHAYSTTAALPAGSLNLAVFDGVNGAPAPSWYGDNSGSISYTITYLGL